MLDHLMLPPAFRLFTAMAVLALLATSHCAFAADDVAGEQIFRKQCASCHGAAGEGVKGHYGKPLAGDRSVDQLTQLIVKSMPKDDPGTCVGADADKVAAYIFAAFYSKAARIELSRLTVRQHQNAI